MLLGKAFAALRHNPKVLFGFAVVIQLIVVIATATATLGLLLSHRCLLHLHRPTHDAHAGFSTLPSAPMRTRAKTRSA